MMIDFDDAPRAFSELLTEKLGAEVAREGRILRDIYGRLSYITARHRDGAFDELELSAAQTLGSYAGPTAQLVVSLSDDQSRFQDFLAETSIGVSVEGQAELRMIDRRLAGDDWLMRPASLVSNPSRLVFYSVKGGVGRSTALAITAADLAARGCNVLVIDIDLEAPGLGSLLLKPEERPKYGVTDWFAAVAADSDAEALIPDMIGSSPFTSARAVVDVVPAAGHEPGAYLSKLARAYTPGSAGERYSGFSFSRKVDALLAQLSSRRKYDAILIDARAGLHETSGGLILGLGAKALLFGVDTPQTFDDLGLLFSAFHQAFDPALGGEDLRGDLKMVHAKAPRDEKDRQLFRERSWEIWSGTLYDDVDPAAELAGNPFVFDLGDEDAPHFPLEIIGDESYVRFNPRTETYALSAEAYEPVFGNFLSGVREMVGQSQ
jgi:hypothetical protein